MTNLRKYVGLLLTALMLFTIAPLNAQEDAMQSLVDGNNQFAFDLLAQISTDNTTDNLIYSPYSISQALAMTYAGANGTTAEQMQATLNYPFAPAEISPIFAEINANLDERSAPPEGMEGQPLQLNIANALWGQLDFPFRADYITMINDNYGAGLELVDFMSDPEAARLQINDWVEEQTEDRIQDIVPQGAITPMTRMVLANAIYFNASWMQAFEENATEDAPFTTLDGEEVTVPMMFQQEMFAYTAGDNYQAISLQYLGGGMSMLVILPEEGAFEDVQSTLSADLLTDIRSAIGRATVRFAMPRYEFEYDIELSGVLTEMGMPLAFSDSADFSGMAEEPIAISEVIHKAFVSVDESGTEAAAATVVTMRATSVMPADDIIDMRLDRPFFFTIIDNQTGSVLFVGRVMNPAS